MVYVANAVRRDTVGSFTAVYMTLPQRYAGSPALHRECAIALYGLHQAQRLDALYMRSE
jgi:hypothetical protein